MIAIRAFYNRNCTENILFIDSNAEVKKEPNQDIKKDDFKIRKRMRIPSEAVFGLFYLLDTNAEYRLNFVRNWINKILADKNLLLNLHMFESKDKLDSLGNKMSSILLWEFIELEDALHWLSTLGGAFSNLGEHDQAFAKRAGENAQKQLIVATKFGDPMVVAKCWLFVAMSLMQQKIFYNAKIIVRNVYAHCRHKSMKNLVGTGKLVVMCRGIWARLCYEASKESTEDMNNSEEIEVEFKFIPPADIINKLQDLGAEQMKSKHIIDIYLDTEDFQLIKQDFWLRYRNGKVEMKIPINDLDQQNISKTTIYKELKCAQKIADFLGQQIPVDVECLPSGWIVLARVETARQIWSWKEFNFVLDSLPDGYQVFEILHFNPTSINIIKTI
jgi:adenylate cyclase class IV